MDVVPVPLPLARPCIGSVSYDGREVYTRPILVDLLYEFKNLAVTKYNGNPSGFLSVVSSYRPAGTKYGLDSTGAIDLTDTHGHWRGEALDFSSEATRLAFWPKAGNHLWLQEIIRWVLYESGWFFPWLYSRNEIGHISLGPTWNDKTAHTEKPETWRKYEVPNNWQDMLKDFNGL